MSTTSGITRMYGLSGSGMDVDSMVKQLMQAAKKPYNELWQKQQVDEWKKTAYHDVYTQVNNFLDNTVTNFKLQGTLAAKSVTSTNTSVATITASGDAATVNHTLSVSQLAAGVNEISSAPLTIAGGSKTTLGDQLGIDSPVSFTINGARIALTKADSINDLVSAINAATVTKTVNGVDKQVGIGVSAAYDTVTDRLFLNSSATGSSAKIDFTGTDTAGLKFLTQKLKLNVYQSVGSAGITGSALTQTNGLRFQSDQALNTQLTDWGGASSFNLQFFDGTNTANYNFDTRLSLKDNMTKLNNALTSAFNPTGAFKNSDGTSFTYASCDTTTSQVTIKAPSGTSLDLSGSDVAATTYFHNELKLDFGKTGQDATFQLDGVTMTQSANKFSIAGINYTLQSTGSTNVTIGTDIDKIVSNVKSFVDSYNTLLSSLYSKINEKYDRNYQPLTDDQKSAMKDTDISLWTDKAKTGLLHSDSTLRNLAETMRDAFSGAVGGIVGDYNTAMSLGISESDDWTLNGQLSVDETTLRAALQLDPNAAYKVFGAGNGSNAATSGVAWRISAAVHTATDAIVDEAGRTADWSTDGLSNLGIEINNYADRLSDMQAKLNSQEDQYYTRFNAMEAAYSRLSQQQSYVSSLLSSS